MNKHLSPSRILLYTALAGLLPLLIVFFNFITQKSELESWSETLEDIKYQAFVTEKKQALNLIVRSHFHDADHFYIDKHLETIPLLQPELESLQKIVKNPSFADDERIKKRLEYLTSGNNLVFSEGVVQTYPLFQEVIETLAHPVEVNADDLSQLLARVEGIPIGNYEPKPHRPQLIVLEMKLDKKRIHEKNEVYVLNLKLLKREYL